MRRRWNVPIWIGVLVVAAVAATYFPLIDRFYDYRDNPWYALLIAGAGLAIGGFGLVRAFRDPATYRGRIVGTILMVLAVAFVGLFATGNLILARMLPGSPGAPRVGQKAPEFTLPDAGGRPVALSDLVASAGGGGVLLIFYRGYW